MKFSPWVVICCIIWLLSPVLAAADQPTLELRFVVKGIDDSDMHDNAQQILKESRGKNKLTKAIIDDLYRQGNKHVREALQPFGYFNVTIKSALTQSSDTWTATYTVTLGSPLKIRHLDIQITGAGQNDPAFRQFLKQLPLKAGQRFTSKAYEHAKTGLFRVANNNGYLNAKLNKKRINIDLHHYYASIHLHLHTGPQFFFGHIDIADNFFAKDFLRRFAPFQLGDAYSTAKLLSYQSNLNNSGYFSEVTIVPQKHKQTAKREIPLAVKVTPVKAQRWLFSAGYGTDTGVRGAVGWQWRRITSGGQHFATNLGISQLIGVNFNSTYYIPGSNPVTDVYTLTASLYNFKTDAGKYFSQHYGVNYITNHPLWQNTYSLLFIDETFTPKGETQQQAHLLMPSVTFSRLVTDNHLKPKYGERISWNLRGAVKQVFSSTSFVQSRLDLKWIQPLWSTARLVSRASLGATFSSNFNRVPLSLRFTAGGATSVRGYGFQSLGPGKYLLTSSVELQQRVYGDFYLGAFYDAGNAFSDAKQEAPLLKAGTGGGVIWDSPVGSIELSLATPLQRSKSLVVQFSMGALL